MKLTITNKDFNIPEYPLTKPVIRIAARGIITSSDGRIAIINKQSKNEFKLPGGGLDDGEEIIDGFIREILEECGATISNITNIGVIKEERSSDSFIQISHVFMATLTNQGETNYTKKELDEKARLLWMSPVEALDKMKNSLTTLIASEYENLYHTNFIVLRDIKILEFYIKNYLITHHLTLVPFAFIAIKNRTKVIEMRLNDERKSLIKVNDLIEFTNLKTNQRILTKVLEVKIFQDFNKLYDSYPKDMLGYSNNEVANYADMYQFYSKDKIAKYGVLAIKVQVLNEESL